ncbi:hypothetical protein FOL47_003680 [Perkinsus chesapeaki]|uniref:Uncharacterized protein n=1 Tax=Perkinsus chesapeaki TaxID=330153 RepID=A0A7J6M6V8_PERCH|nr:hypothetical protein FOL47_003680 [Perkinsus chesapeaki]
MPTELPEHLSAIEDSQEVDRRLLARHALVDGLIAGFVQGFERKFLNSMEADFRRLSAAKNYGIHRDGWSIAVEELEQLIHPLLSIDEDIHMPTEDIEIARNLAARRLVEGADAASSGRVRWSRFLDYIIATEELLRNQPIVCSRVHEFNPSPLNQATAGYKPVDVKAFFHAIIVHPGSSVLPRKRLILLEENSSVFHISGEQIDTIRNLPCAFSDTKTWEFAKTYIGSLCWATKIRVLFGADHFSGFVYQWTISSLSNLRLEEPPTKLRRIHTDIAGHAMRVNRILWIERMEAIITAGMDKKIVFWDTIQSRTMFELNAAHTKAVTNLAYNGVSCKGRVGHLVESAKLRIGSTVLSAGYDSTINIWDAYSGVKVGALEGHTSAVTSLEVLERIGSCLELSVDASDSTQCMSADMGGTIRLWHIGRRECIQVFNSAHGLPKGIEDGSVDPRCLAFVTNDVVAMAGKRFLYFSRDETRPQSTSDGPILPETIAFNGRVGHIVTTANTDVVLWNALTGKRFLVCSKVASSSITAICIENCDERIIIIGTEKGTLAAHNYSTMTKIRAFKGHTRKIASVAWREHRIFSLCAGNQLMIHDGSHIVAEENHPPPVLKTLDLTASGTVVIDYFIQGRQVAHGSEDGTVSWYRIDSGKLESSRLAPQTSTAIRASGTSLVAYLTVPTANSKPNASATLSLSSSGAVTLFGLQPMERFEPLISWRLAWSSQEGTQRPMIVTLDDTAQPMVVSASLVVDESQQHAPALQRADTKYYAVAAENHRRAVRREEVTVAASPTYSMRSGLQQAGPGWPMPDTLASAALKEEASVGSSTQEPGGLTTGPVPARALSGVQPNMERTHHSDDRSGKGYRGKEQRISVCQLITDGDAAPLENKQRLIVHQALKLRATSFALSVVA